jgi:hypothetical protein
MYASDQLRPIIEFIGRERAYSSEKLVNADLKVSRLAISSVVCANAPETETTMRTAISSGTKRFIE